MNENNEEPTKDYKYRVELADDIKPIRPIYGDTSRQIEEVTRNNRNGVWKETLNVVKKTLKVNKRTASEYGEFIASLIFKKIGFLGCDVDILKRKIPFKYSKSGKTAEVPGCISYIDLKPGESLVQAINILAWYKSEHTDKYFKIMNPLGLYDENDYKINPNNQAVNNNIELIIPAFEAYVKEKCNGTQEQCDEIRQHIIDMVVFDCRFANRDRHDENYGLSIDREGNVRFYPVYDNEYILGFSEVEEDVRKYSAARLQEHISKDLYSKMGVTSQPTQISSAAMMTYLFTTYPEETEKSYEKISKFKEMDLVEIMDECEGLSDFYKAYALRIFRLRQKELDSIKEEYIDEQGNLIPQELLPGNKPMENIKARGGSKSKKSGNKEIDDSKRKTPSLDD